MKPIFTSLLLLLTVWSAAQSEAFRTEVVGNRSVSTVDLRQLHEDLTALFLAQNLTATDVSALTAAFNGLPPIPTAVSDLPNDVGYTTFNGDYASLTNAPTSVTTFDDVTDAGSGAIITASERTLLASLSNTLALLDNAFDLLDSMSAELTLLQTANNLSFSCGGLHYFDGYAYETIEIGTQCWFAENLRSTRYNDGSVIPSSLSAAEWEAADVVGLGASAVYGEGMSPCTADCDETANLTTYGRLYNGFAVNTAMLCPSGWHVPSDAEWTSLTDFLNPNAGLKMKSGSWDGSNESGFSALPGGIRASNGSFNVVGDHTYFWSSSPSGSTAWNRELYSGDANVYRYNDSQRGGFSVRCVRDVEGVVCTSDADSDGICDDVDPCVGSYDACGVCNGPGEIYECGCSVIPDGDCDCDGNQIDAIGVCGGSCPADANGNGICDDVDPSLFQCGNAMSYQGHDYATVLIGDQCWFAENLRCETYSNGDPILQGLSNVDWLSTEEGALAYYNDNATSEVAYGALYNWYAVADVRGLCPPGWHVPTDLEWTAMTDGLGGESVAGLKMKTAYGWMNDGGGNNLSGFSGLPAGFRAADGLYFNEGYAGYWWSSTSSGVVGWYRELNLESAEVIRSDTNEGPQESGSIRCILDAP